MDNTVIQLRRYGNGRVVSKLVAVERAARNIESLMHILNGTP